MTPFGKRLTAAMESAGITASALEEKLGFEAGSIDKWINDPIPPDTATVNALAEALSVSPNTLLFGVERLGEIKAMFPDDKTAAPSPFSTWQFMTGLILVFTGLAGALLLVMRFVGTGFDGSLFDEIALPLAILGAISLAGLGLCIGISVKNMKSKKEKKNEKKDK